MPSLEPLDERIRVEFRDGEPDNLRQPQIRLMPFNRDRLIEVARKVRAMYPTAHRDRLVQRAGDDVLEAVVESVTQGFGGHVEIVPRLFLREWVHLLDLVDQSDAYHPRETWRYEGGPGLDLTPEEDGARHGAEREILL